MRLGFVDQVFDRPLRSPIASTILIRLQRISQAPKRSHSAAFDQNFTDYTTAKLALDNPPPTTKPEAYPTISITPAVLLAILYSHNLETRSRKVTLRPRKDRRTGLFFF